MIYPNNFESKIGFTEIRRLLRGECLSTLGSERVDTIAFSTQVDEVNEWLRQVSEFRRIQEEEDDFPLNYFFDVRASVARVRLENTHLEENELFDLRRSLETIHDIVTFLRQKEQGEEKVYPTLYRLSEDVVTFPHLIQRIDQLLDKFGHIRDNASPELLHIRQALKRTEGSISRTLYSILHSAQSEGIIEKDITPTMRDGRLVIPVAPGLKRRIKGIVHDESASGRTVFIEPTEVVEANNKIRELEAEERREIIRILTEFSKEIRPHVNEMLASYQFLAAIDLIRAKAELARQMKGIEPTVNDRPMMDWIRAIHPLLETSLQKQGKQVVPLDIRLEERGKGKEEKNIGRLLIISGPNAGGKSVCLKTAGLLQYMLQCGLSVPMSERSQLGMFQSIMIDIGDEQSIENDLSTYSSHLLNMKNMMKQANEHTLLLIDEFGGGTEPQIGGAIAEAVLKQFWKKKTFGIITTHYQNLKHFAEDHPGIVNGAMLYDRHQMQALFQLSIGQPGASFAIEIARKTGIPDEVINDASEIVGSDYIQSDKYLQDIVRDKRYWENKRQNIHQREKDMERTIERYETDLSDIEQSRKEILHKAQEQAEELLKESNKRIENAIREIREAQAQKEETRRIREELESFRSDIQDIDTRAEDEKIAKKIAQLQARKERKEKRKKEKANAAASKNEENSNTQKPAATPTEKPTISVGQTVRIKGLQSVGRVESISGKMATVIFGDMRTKMRAERLEPASEEKKPKNEDMKESLQAYNISRETRDTIDAHRKNFHQDLDVRGMRGDEALNAVTYFIDDAILMGMSRVRILHGKGNGILRQLIRQYLSTVPNVTHYADEHVQFGGAGITVVDL
ncbi:MAG: Smr/MutS family protein [Prevotella sp.]|nr:Smr/MutS family protein [Prevotella sp.]